VRPLSFPVGTVITLTATGQGSPDRIVSWQGACAGIGGGINNQTGACTFTLNSNTTASVWFENVGD